MKPSCICGCADQNIRATIPSIEAENFHVVSVASDFGEQNQRLVSAFDKEKKRLLAWIRRRIPDGFDADDVLQEAFYELIEAYRDMAPIGHVGAWLMRVAQNRITDLFRRRSRTAELSGDERVLQDLLPSPSAGPDALYARQILIAEIEAALDELPRSQREVFLAHEIEGLSFAQISEKTGVGLNTLLSRKHYALKRLRSRLQRIYEETVGGGRKK